MKKVLPVWMTVVCYITVSSFHPHYSYILKHAGCPNGTYWQDCSRNCTCENGGECNIDGKCDCPRGWTGPNCLQPSKDKFTLSLIDI